MSETVRIDKLVHGGQGIGTLLDGKKVFVWNALPGELLTARILKGKKQFAEAIAEQIIEQSPERIEPVDDAYLSTSPWQIMTFEAENRYKQAILAEAMQREKVAFDQDILFASDDQQYHYRNKMEYSFWGDEQGLHLALFHRGSHAKRIVTGSSIARPEIDKIANKICSVLNGANIRASQLKTVIIRCDQQGSTAAALFVKDENFPRITELAELCQGLSVNYSNPKSPASVLTKQLYCFGDTTLTDALLNTKISYEVTSFFQVNVPVFERAAAKIALYAEGAKSVVDFYSGVGTIGIPVGATVLVESDYQNIVMANKNAKGKNIEVIHATAETATSYVPSEGVLIIDPPRAGLHTHMTQTIREKLPDAIAYLSCNPSTQARDLAMLQSAYKITEIIGYNFFPRTPHIESLAILEKR